MLSKATYLQLLTNVAKASYFHGPCCQRYTSYRTYPTYIPLCILNCNQTARRLNVFEDSVSTTTFSENDLSKGKLTEWLYEEQKKR